MKNNRCVYLKPQVYDPEGREDRDIISSELILPAIESVGLECLKSDEESDGSLVVERISDDLISLVHSADIVVIDVRCYENSNNAFNLSPYLYYMMAFSHSLGNKTILVGNKEEHAEYGLLPHRTIVYSDQGLKGLKKFKIQFGNAVEKIQAGDKKPDNPIQLYIDRIRSEELEKKLARKDAELEELKRKKKAFEEKQAEVNSTEEEYSRLNQKIIFRPVSTQPH